MLIEILNKILYLLFCLSGLNVIRTVFFLIGSFIKSDEEQPQKFRLNSMQLVLLGLSIAYIISSLIKGIEIIL